MYLTNSFRLSGVSPHSLSAKAFGLLNTVRVKTSKSCQMKCVYGIVIRLFMALFPLFVYSAVYANIDSFPVYWKPSLVHFSWKAVVKGTNSRIRLCHYKGCPNTHFFQAYSVITPACVSLNEGGIINKQTQLQSKHWKVLKCLSVSTNTMMRLFARTENSGIE